MIERRTTMGTLLLLLGAGLALVTVEEGRPVVSARVVDINGYRISLDLSRAMIRAVVPEDKSFGDREGKVEPELSPTPRIDAGFLPAAALGWKAKQFDDGLYAAVELQAQDGANGGKRELLRFLADVMSGARAGETGNVAGVVLGAARLGGVTESEPAALRPEIDQTVAPFLADEKRSKPIGFYTQNDALTRIFQQDRLLQTELDGKLGIDRLARALQRSAQHRKIYADYLAMVEKLTNPLTSPDLRAALAGLDAGVAALPEKGVSILPASRSNETELIKRLYGEKPIPVGFDLASELIKRVRSGSLSLEPVTNSGWYDRQTWALEPLIVPDRMPEGSKVTFTASYREQLDALFRALLTLTRETHVKQVEFPTPGDALPPDLIISPLLTVEPLPTHYLRRALAYAFVRQTLTDAFGLQTLTSMRRFTPDGRVSININDELLQMQAICFGAYAASCIELGLPLPARHEAATTGDPPADRQTFQNWLRQIDQDPDLGGDSRVMVPVFYDTARGQTKVWVVLGWAERLAFYSYQTQPELSVTRDGKPVDMEKLTVEFEEQVAGLPYPVTAEVYVNRILDRDQFRALCDQHRTQTAILNALGE